MGLLWRVGLEENVDNSLLVTDTQQQKIDLRFWGILFCGRLGWPPRAWKGKPVTLRTSVLALL